MKTSSMSGAAPLLRDRIAAGIMFFAALAAAYAFVSSIGTALASGPAQQQVEWWRVLGFLMFSGVFVLLALGPRRYPGLWELVILDKAALTIVEIALIGNQADNALSSAVIDGILTVLILVAYLLSRGYASWRRS
jgi:hypothetical protein